MRQHQVTSKKNLITYERPYDNFTCLGHYVFGTCLHEFGLNGNAIFPLAECAMMDSFLPVAFTSDRNRKYVGHAFSYIPAQSIGQSHQLARSVAQSESFASCTGRSYLKLVFLWNTMPEFCIFLNNQNFTALERKFAVQDEACGLSRRYHGNRAVVDLLRYIRPESKSSGNVSVVQ
ncbi:unnamed protein product [Haemonchus placei]|uniref:Ash family protein n=1 Tax=Haemonchus placei TaxID=6290 RepID=A0A0N4W7J4_HAEPC|nr:unnamed protein product [Haemonchus placei]